MMNKNNFIRHPFSRQLMFAKVMEDAGLCRDMLRLIYENRLEQQLKEGLERGIEQTKRKIARAMKADNEPVEKIAKYTGLSMEEIEALV